MSEFETGTADANSEESASTPENGEKQYTWTPFGGFRRIALAGIGAVSVATEVTDEVFSELVKRGEQSREEARDEMRHARARTARRNADAAEFFRARMNDLMDRFNLPSKGDVDSINAKLNILTRKVDEFQAAQVGDASATSAPGDDQVSHTDPST
jgi:poly(hydroxyalkanoate) granule-associated protein